MEEKAEYKVNDYQTGWKDGYNSARAVYEKEIKEIRKQLTRIASGLKGGGKLK